MNGTIRITHAVSAAGPENVAELSRRLFPAYTIDGGRVHLAGCTLDDRLFARLEGRPGEQPADLVVDAQGETAGSELIHWLGLEQTVPWEKPTPAAVAAVEDFQATTLPRIQRQLADQGGFHVESLTALWAKFAAGKLRFSAGPQSVDLAFAGWARTLSAPPFLCPYSGLQTFHLAVTDDGRIAAFEGIARCDVSGRRTVANELVECAASKRRVLKELTERCPVSGARVLSTEMTVCAMCGQRVSPTCIVHGRCAACRNLHRVEKTDPRVVQLLEKNPTLALWSNWRIGETQTVTIFVAQRWLKRVLAVVRKDSFDVALLATGNWLMGPLRG